MIHAQLSQPLLLQTFASQHESVLKFVARGYDQQARDGTVALVRTARELAYRAAHGVRRPSASDLDVVVAPDRARLVFDYSGSGL